MPITITAFKANEIACTSSPSSMWPSTCGSAISLPSNSRNTATTDPTSPQIRPSSMKGPRTNQLVAPTSFMTSISRRREKIESRIVFAIKRVEAARRIATASRKSASITRATLRIRLAVFSP